MHISLFADVEWLPGDWKTQKKAKARAEASNTDVRYYATQFQQAKVDELKSWQDNEVYDLVDMRTFTPKTT